MKTISIIASALIMLCACNQPSSTTTETKDTTVSNNTAPSSAPTISIPYTPTYATDFEFGDYKYAQILFNLMKQYDDNNFNSDFENAFADSATVAGGTGKDSVFNVIKHYRQSLTAAKESVITYVVLHPKSTSDTWVSIWGNEADTHKNGKTDTTWFNDNWKFNKDGKIADRSQYIDK